MMTSRCGGHSLCWSGLPCSHGRVRDSEPASFEQLAMPGVPSLAGHAQAGQVLQCMSDDTVFPPEHDLCES
jgi:hypothetical protein